MKPESRGELIPQTDRATASDEAARFSLRFGDDGLRLLHVRHDGLAALVKACPTSVTLKPARRSLDQPHA